MNRSYREDSNPKDPYLNDYSAPAREWWAQRWIDVLESFGFRQRMARARTYAQAGNVLSLEFKAASVVAVVQGSVPDPYKVRFQLEPFSDEQWSYIVESMAEQAIFSAKLLSGEMPQDIEQVFTQNGLSLFPFNQFDIHSHCDCPDPVNPCKHIGAVYYLLGDRFGEDPFVLFQLRGRTKAEIIEALRARRRSIAETGSPEDGAATLSELAHATTVPFQFDPTSFWTYTQPIDPALIFLVPSTSESVLDLIGSPPEELASAVNAEHWIQVWGDRNTQVTQQIMTQANESASE
jgi:uncharacterized Zn finger protein